MKSILIILCLICFESPSQELPSLNKYDISSYNRRLYRKLKKLECTRKNESRSILFIYHLKLNGKVSKEEFNASFLKSNLSFIENSETDFPGNTALVYNDSLKVIAEVDDLRVYCAFDGYLEGLLTLAVSGSFDLVFSISGTNGAIFFGWGKEEISVFEVSDENVRVYQLKEFVDCCWERLYIN